MASNNYTVSFSGASIQTTVTKKAAEVNDWVADILSSSNGNQRIIVGLDSEWKPNISTYDNNRTAILQLCVGNKCLIIQMFYLDNIPQSLKDFFSNHNVTFVGVDVHDDVTKLRREYGLVLADAEDIQAKAMAAFPAEFYRKPGLKRLAKKLVGLEMAKPLHICRSNWEERVLSVAQIEYATIDAYASLMVGINLIDDDTYDE